MSHEITRTDTFIGYQKGGWHGLGKVFNQKVKTAREVVKLSGIDWMVEQWSLEARDPNNSLAQTVNAVSTHVLNVRSDNHEPLGVVGAGYVPCQNQELAEFAFSVAEESRETLHLETAGSLRGGRRVWLLLSGARFHVGKNDNDAVDTFLLVANGHDGSLSIWAQPTSTRVVCANTLHMAMSSAQRNIRLRHEGNLSQKIAEAQRTLNVYGSSVKEFQSQCDTLSLKGVSKKDLDEFFLEAWTRTQFSIPKNPQNEKEKSQRDKALEAYTTFCNNVDKDAAEVGRSRKPSLWNGLNAFTEYLQHQKPARGKDEQGRREARVFSDMFGPTADAKQEAFNLALARV